MIFYNVFCYVLDTIIQGAIILSACSFNLSSSQVDLDDSAWVLTEIDNDTTIIGNSPTLEFDVDVVSGNASCNIYSRGYQVEGETISFGPLARTEMYCMEPEGVMDQEQTYYHPRYHVRGMTFIPDYLYHLVNCWSTHDLEY